MNVPINATRLRATLSDVVKRVRQGTRFTVIYRRHPAFQIVPVDDAGETSEPLTADSLYGAKAVGSSSDYRAATDHDSVLYRR
jgi:antitoxin (DNA-binding transcriptional repressor) of toxin-antitoxin stability system